MWKIRQLFHATNFLSLMHPCFIVCRILGIFPYKINASTIETSRLRYILPTLVIFLVCIYDLQILHEIITWKTVNFRDVTFRLQGICYITLANFIAIITYILSGPRMHVLQAMLKFSLRLPPKTYQKLSRWIHVKDVLGTIFILTQELAVYFEHKYTFLPIMPIYLALLMFHMDMQYINCICVTKACFKRINDNLMRMQKIIINDNPYVSRLIYHTQKNQFLLRKLEILKKHHLIVSDTVQMLNVIFSLQLLATTTLTFTEIIFQAYLLVTRFQDRLYITLNDIHKVCFRDSTAYVILKFILIVWAYETNKNQAFQIGITVHDVLNRTSDEQIKEELQLFSLQILHRKKTFSTKGLSVDATLLTAMMGSVTTYMLILIQFMLMTRSCDGKSESDITQ